jgi:hypothetical protein
MLAQLAALRSRWWEADCLVQQAERESFERCLSSEPRCAVAEKAHRADLERLRADSRLRLREFVDRAALEARSHRAGTLLPAWRLEDKDPSSR